MGNSEQEVKRKQTKRKARIWRVNFTATNSQISGRQKQEKDLGKLTVENKKKNA
jgi:hypothetical protein